MERQAVDPALEARFRAGYGRGWIGAVDALSQLCDARGLTPKEAADLLRRHKQDALDKWASERLQHGLYPPRVSAKRAG